MLQRVAVFALAAVGLFTFTATAMAQPYPGRTVTIVCPYPAGGPTDQTARVIADFLSRKFNQNFIVENVTGGGTSIATNRVAKASPDGYTLLLHNLQISANATLYKNVPFDTAKDLTGVMLVNNNPLVLVGRKDLPPNTLPELLAFMKKERLKAALPGYGATGHLATTLLAQEAGVHGRPNSVSRRRAGHDRSVGRTCRSVLRHAAVGRAAGEIRTAQGLWRHFQNQAGATA